MGRGGGFPTDKLITNEALIEEFVCPICMQLVEMPVITACDHVFCRNCWDEWMSRPHVSSKCPKCNRIFSGEGAQMDSEPAILDLRSANPLAWRVLSRVQIRCALSECTWKGNYSDLSSHLLASDSHRTAAGAGVSPSSAKADAEALKAQGNARFEARSFQEAIKLYTKAITLDATQPSFFANRAAAWLMCGVPNECIKDCEQALALDPRHERSHMRMAKALLDLGLLQEARAHVRGAAEKMQDCHELAREVERLDHLVDKFEAAEAAFEGREVRGRDPEVRSGHGTEGEERGGGARL